MARVVILGGGIIGLSLAYELSRRGVGARVLERREPGREASWAGAGILTPAGGDGARRPIDRLRALSLARLDEWSRDLRTETGIDNGFLKCGSLRLALSDREVADLDREAASWRAEGVEIHQVSVERRRELAPALGAEVTRAYHLPGEAQVRNPRHLRALTVAACRRGVTVDSGTPATGFVEEGARVRAVTTPRGPVEGDAFVVACGAWSPPLLEAVGLELPGEPVRGQIVLLDAGTPPLGQVLWWGPRYVVPRPDGRVLVGSTQERTGFDRSPTAGGVRGILDAARRLVPQLEGASFVRAWAGLRPGTHDDHPYLGAVPGRENLWVATGHLRAGLELSAGTAVVLADLIEGRTPPVPVEPFLPQRFVAP